MKKPKFSLDKAKRAVEISSMIEGHKIPKQKKISSKRVNLKKVTYSFLW